MKKKAPIRILWKFQCKKGDFGFVIPDDRADWGWDFFVHQKNFFGAVDGQRVAAEIMDRDSGRKPEAKIIELFGSKKQEEDKKHIAKVVEWVFSGGSGDFGFVDVPGREEGYFCHKAKFGGAKDGDRVRAEIKKYNGKDEAIVIEILEAVNLGQVTGIYSDMEGFGFVKTDDKSDDIFIAGSRKADAKTGDTIEVRIIKIGGRRREGVIEKIL